MSTPILRGLAKAYSDGLIDRKQYIRERRHLIDDIVAGNIELVPYEQDVAARPEPESERTFSDGEATLEIPRFDSEAPTTPVTPRKSGRGGLVFVLLAVGAAAAAGGWWLITNNASTSAEPPVPPPPASEERANPAAVLLEGFLAENNWRAERIEGFLLDWSGETPAARAALNDSPTMRRAAESISQQILEEKALFELGERDDALRKQRRLLDLATALSIANDRLVRAEADWQANSAEQITTQASATPPVEAVTSAEPVDEDAVDPPAPVAVIAEPEPEPESEPEPAPAPEPVLPTATEPTREDENAAEAPPVEAPSTQPLGEETAPDAAGTVVPPAPAPATVAAAPQTSAKPRAKRTGCRAELANKRRPYCRDPLGNDLNGPTLAVLRSGQASIGGTKPEEKPRYTVSIPRPFGLGVYEVSVNEFNAYCRATGRPCPTQPWSDPKLPVVNVSWTQARDYTQWLSEITGATYRLPSESEWEYAARAGTTTAYPFGDEVLPTHARFSFRGPETMPLAANDKTINRNKFRLYHMVGNVREWALDVWHDDHRGAAADGSARTGSSGARVARGGSYGDGADRVRSASRVRLDGGAGDPQTGFRVLREID